MKIGLQTWGTQGDVEPFLSLARALATAGHEVRLVVTTQVDRSYASPPGVELLRVGPPMTQADGDALIERVIALKSPIAQARVLLEDGFLPCVDDMYDAARELVAWSDLVVRHHFLYMTQVAAQAADTPEVSVFFTPDLLPTKTRPPTGMPSFGPLQSAAWWLADRGISRVFGPPAAKLREEAGLGRSRGVLQDVWASSTANLVAVSPTLFPRPDDWPSSTHLTGFWNAPATTGSDLSHDLERFFEAGPPPVFATFGSMASASGERHAADRRLLVDAAREAGTRLVLQQPNPHPVEGDDVIAIARAPHAEAFARCASVVHHGGAGTTQTAIRSGVPSVVVPHLADQFFWASQIEQLGVGFSAPGRSKVTSARLARAIEQACTADAACARAAEIGASLDDEDGVARAVGALTMLAER